MIIISLFWMFVPKNTAQRVIFKEICQGKWNTSYHPGSLWGCFQLGKKGIFPRTVLGGPCGARYCIAQELPASEMAMG